MVSRIFSPVSFAGVGVVFHCRFGKNRSIGDLIVGSMLPLVFACRTVCTKKSKPSALGKTIDVSFADFRMLGNVLAMLLDAQCILLMRVDEQYIFLCRDWMCEPQPVPRTRHGTCKKKIKHDIETSTFDKAMLFLRNLFVDNSRDSCSLAEP